MNHKKIILVGAISGLVTVLTWILGISGTIMGSVLFSVLYTMLSEWLEDPVSNASFNPDFEWDIVYVVPLVVIALIQVLLIFALLAERGILPYTFVNFFLSLQQLTDNNLYRLLGIALLFISAYPLVLKPNYVKKEHGLILAIVGVIFLARGFVDLGNFITNIYDAVFVYFDLPIAIIAFLLISFVIYRILSLSNESNKEFKQNQIKNENRVHVNHEKMNVSRNVSKKVNVPKNSHQRSHDVKFRGNVRHNPNMNQKTSKGFNTSANDIHFESNDLLDEYKK
jgi:large-conductance mechanosensitive channel